MPSVAACSIIRSIGRRPDIDEEVGLERLHLQELRGEVGRVAVEGDGLELDGSFFSFTCRSVSVTRPTP